MTLSRRAFIHSATATGLVGGTLAVIPKAMADQGTHLKITLVSVHCDKTTGNGSDTAFSLAFHSTSNNALLGPDAAVNSPKRKYNIANNSVLFDDDVHPGDPWQLEIWADKHANIIGPHASNIGAIFIFTNTGKQLGYSPVVTGRVFHPGEHGDPADCISFRMENSGSSYKMLMKWEYQGQVFVGQPISGWNG